MSAVDDKPTHRTEDKQGINLGQEAAYATPDMELDGVGLRLGQYGLTKRELFAAMIMQGYVSTGRTDPPFDRAEWAVRNADALLKELAK